MLVSSKCSTRHVRFVYRTRRLRRVPGMSGRALFGLWLLLLLLWWLVRPTAAVLDPDQFPQIPCWQTLDEFDVSSQWSDWDNNTVSMLPYQPVAALCPPNCLAESRRNESMQVYGSFPYRGRSSVCLSGVHAGVISDRAGGGLYVSYFFRHSWGQDASQSIFPFSSSSGTLSNGVQSYNVTHGRYSVPSSAAEHSYSLRARGDLVVQRRRAPFPPRAGHVHQRWKMRNQLQASQVDLPNPQERIYEIHIVMGGYNESHYMNDVWLGTQRLDGQYEDVEWYRLPDAPFTPRADMQTRWMAPRVSVERPWTVQWNNTYNELLPRPVLRVLGGQTGHNCSLRELGLCSSEVWEANLTVTADYTFDLLWHPTPMLLPFPSRCEPLLFARDWLVAEVPELVEYDQFVWMAGQLSYNDSTCTAPPVTVNEVWAASLHSATHSFTFVAQQADAAFSPRRLTPVDDSARLNWMDMCAAGGIRHESIVALGNDRALLNGSRVFADIYCFTLYRVGTPNATLSLTTHMRWLNGGNNTANAGHLLPTATYPLPTAGGVTTAAMIPESINIGGFVPAAAVKQLEETVPGYIDWEPYPDISRVFLNVSAILQVAPYSLDDMGQNPRMKFEVNWTVVDRLRLGLPLDVLVSAEELNDPQGAYQLGSDVFQAYQSWETYTLGGGAYRLEREYLRTTAHKQPTAFVNDPQQSTPFVPLAASASNTSRSQFNFRLRRMQPRIVKKLQQMRYGWWGMREGQGAPQPSSIIVTSGGYSGQTYYNDWIVSHGAHCLPPSDPSFADTLGLVEVLGNFTYYVDEWHMANSYGQGSFMVADEVEVRCNSNTHHWNPPNEQAVQLLSCTPTGAWMPMYGSGIARCERNANLSCNFPLTDQGAEGGCVPADTIIHEVRGYQQVAGDPTPRIILNDDAPDPVTVTNIPWFSPPQSSSGTVQLRMEGNVFFEPISVTLWRPIAPTWPYVADCGDAYVTDGSDAPATKSVCWEDTDPSTGRVEQVCAKYGTQVRCTLPQRWNGTLQVMQVHTGPYNSNADWSPTNNRFSVGQLMSQAPVITSLNSADCSASAGLDNLLASSFALVHCPIQQITNVKICAMPVSLAGLEMDGTGMTVRVGDLLTTVATCSPFSHVSNNGASGDVCADCSLYPRLGSLVTIKLCNDPYYMDSSRLPFTLSFRQCPDGTIADKKAALTGNATDLCIECPAGYASAADGGEVVCKACPAGTFSNETGQDACTPCPIGHEQPLSGQVACKKCPLNSYATEQGLSNCIGCLLDDYLWYDRRDTSRQAGACTHCPTGAQCGPNGTIAASQATYLLLDRQSTAVVAARCWASACVGASALSPSVGAWNEIVPISGLQLINQCASGRWPAYVADRSLYALEPALEADGGHNVQCALPARAQRGEWTMCGVHCGAVGSAGCMLGVGTATRVASTSHAARLDRQRAHVGPVVLHAAPSAVCAALWCAAAAVADQCVAARRALKRRSRQRLDGRCGFRQRRRGWLAELLCGTARCVRPPRAGSRFACHRLCAAGRAGRCGFGDWQSCVPMHVVPLEAPAWLAVRPVPAAATCVHDCSGSEGEPASPGAERATASEIECGTGARR